MFYKKIKFKNDFNKYVIILMMGTGLAQLISILISPLLTRLYTPDAFGTFALFLAVVSIFSGVANGRYDVTVVLSDKKEDAYNLLVLGFIISIIFCFVLSLLVFFFKEDMVFLLGNQEIEQWLYLIPISVFFVSLFSLLNYFNTREKNYNDIKNANISRAIMVAIIQISAGLFKLGSIGLIVGQFASQVVSIRKLLKNIINDKEFLKALSIERMKEMAFRYKEYPLYSTWSSLLNTASIQVPIIMLTSFYGLEVAGLYALAFRVVGSPMSIIGNVFGQVFYQRACELKHDKKELSSFTFLTYQKLVKISVIPFVILIASSDILFGVIFGQEWVKAGQYIQVLAFWFLFVFISSPLSMLLMTLEKQKQNLFFNIIMFLSRVIVIAIGGGAFIDASYTIFFYGIISFLLWLTFCIYLLILAEVNLLKALKYTLIYVILGTFLGLFLRYFILI